MQFFSADHTLVTDLRELRPRTLFGSLAPRGPGSVLLANRRLSLKRAAALAADGKYAE
jgi:hypothetical protein